MNTLWEYLENVLFGWGVTSRDGRQRSTGRRRSIVRMIGSMLPFIKATRVHLNLAVWQNDEFEHSQIHSPVQCNPGSIDEGLDSASTLFCEGIHLQERDDMSKILEEIKELKMKMNEILERQNGGQCCDSGHHNLSVPIIRYDNSNPAPPVPPPPPPPPPPMPTTLTAFLPSPMSASTPRIGKSGKQRPSTQPGLNDVLNELKENKFRLKSIPRTPGGRPIKQPSSDSDTPGSNGGETRTDLAEILRKRLQYVQCSDSDCSFSSSFNDSSVLVDHN